MFKGASNTCVNGISPCTIYSSSPQRTQKVCVCIACTVSVSLERNLQALVRDFLLMRSMLIQSKRAPPTQGSPTEHGYLLKAITCFDGVCRFDLKHFHCNFKYER